MKVVIAETVDWDTSVRIGSHHYAQQFLDRGDEVLWVSQYVHPLSLLTGPRERTRRAFGLRRGMQSAQHEGLFLYVPFTFLPCRRRRFLDSERVGHLSLRLALPSVRSVVKRLGFGRVDVVWISNPLIAGIADLVDHDVLVFRVNDRYSGFAGMPRCAEALEKRLIRRADIVLATSRVLARQIESAGGAPVLLPNGADVEHFAAPMAAPAEYSTIASPRVVYAGAIESWFDAELMASAAKASPNTAFILIGQCGAYEAETLAGIPNVHLLGPRFYGDLPGYYQHADAGIIPFRVNELTEAVNPNKLYEYFAAGLPVVSTYLPEIKSLEPLVRIARSTGEFSDLLREALNGGKDDALRSERVKCAESNSWKARFHEATVRISHAMRSRQPGAA